MADIATQEEAFRLLREGARLLYTSAAGQPVQLGDVNAWFEQFNGLTRDESLRLGDSFGPIVAREAESDPLIDRAQAALDDLAGRVTTVQHDFAEAVALARRGGA